MGGKKNVKIDVFVRRTKTWSWLSVLFVSNKVVVQLKKIYGAFGVSLVE